MIKVKYFNNIKLIYNTVRKYYNYNIFLQCGYYTHLAKLRQARTN